MALQYAIGSYNQPAGSAPVSLFVPTQDASGAAFDPQAVLLFGNTTSSLNGNSGAHFRMGLSDGSRQICHDSAFGPLFGGYQTESMWSTANAFCSVRNIAINQQIFGGYLTMGSGGFTAVTSMTGLAASSGGDLWCYAAFGGSGISCRVGYYQVGTNTIDVTAPGFQPTGLLGWASTGVPTGGFLNGNGGRFGMAFGSDGCGYMGAATASGSNAPTDTARYQRTNRWIVNVNTLGSVLTDSTIDAMLPTGFRVTHVNGSASDYRAYLAINGVAVNVVSFLQPGVGLQSVPITAGVPRLVLVTGVNAVPSGSPSANLALSLGVGDTVRQRAIWAGSLNGEVSPFKFNQVTDLSHLIYAGTPTGSFANSVAAQASLTGLRNGFFDLNWTASDGVAREWIAMVLADLPASLDPCGGVPVPPACVPTPPDVPGSSTPPTEFGSGSVDGGGGIIV